MRIDKNNISDFSKRCLTKLNVPEAEAELITKILLEADLREIHSHGFLRLPIYAERIEKGLIKNKANISIENETETLAVLDGNYSSGQITAHTAMEKSIKKAEEQGVGLVAVKNSNHFGISAFYSLMASAEEKIGIVISNVSPLMPAIGGTEKIIGNNPISIAAPTRKGKDPIVLDMALSNTAFGKILYAKEQNQNIPLGWGLDAHGKDTENPEDVINGGFLSPVGGPKGFGLAIMAEILTGVLSGGQFSKMIPSMYDLTSKQSISHFMLTIDIKQLISLNLYYESITQLTDYIKNSRKAENIQEIFMPGEIEFSKERINSAKGIPMEEDTFKKLNELADNLQVERLLN